MCDGKWEGGKMREEGRRERVTLEELVIERMTGKGNERGMKKKLFHSFCWYFEVIQVQTAGIWLYIICCAAS